MREVDWDNYGQSSNDVECAPNAIKKADGDPGQILKETRAACAVPIEVFLNWLGWFDYKLANGGGGIEEITLGELLDWFMSQTQDPDIRKKFEGDSLYWIYATPNHPSTSGGVVL